MEHMRGHLSLCFWIPDGLFLRTFGFGSGSDEEEKIYKKSKKCIALLCREYYTIHIDII